MARDWSRIQSGAPRSIGMGAAISRVGAGESHRSRDYDDMSPDGTRIDRGDREEPATLGAPLAVAEAPPPPVVDAPPVAAAVAEGVGSPPIEPANEPETHAVAVTEAATGAAEGVGAPESASAPVETRAPEGVGSPGVIEPGLEAPHGGHGHSGGGGGGGGHPAHGGHGGGHGHGGHGGHGHGGHGHGGRGRGGRWGRAWDWGWPGWDWHWDGADWAVVTQPECARWGPEPITPSPTLLLEAETRLRDSGDAPVSERWGGMLYLFTKDVTRDASGAITGTTVHVWPCDGLQSTVGLYGWPEGIGQPFCWHEMAVKEQTPTVPVRHVPPETGCTPSSQWGSHVCGEQCTMGSCIKDTNYLSEKGMGTCAGCGKPVGVGPTPCNCRGRVPTGSAEELPSQYGVSPRGMGAADFQRVIIGLGDYPALAAATLKVAFLASPTTSDVIFASSVPGAVEAVNSSVSEAYAATGNNAAYGYAKDTRDGTAWAAGRNGDVIKMLAGQQSGQGPGDTYAAARTDIVNALTNAVGNAKLALDALVAPPNTATFAQATIDKANAVKGLATPCNLTASCATVKAFQVAYNADPKKTVAVPTDGKYTGATVLAVAQVLGGIQLNANQCPNFTGACAGGAGPQPPPVPPQADQGGGTNWTPWIIGGAVVGGLGLVGWAMLAKPTPKAIEQAAKELREEAAHKKTTLRLREASEDYDTRDEARQAARAQGISEAQVFPARGRWHVPMKMKMKKKRAA